MPAVRIGPFASSSRPTRCSARRGSPGPARDEPPARAPSRPRRPDATAARNPSMRASTTRDVPPSRIVAVELLCVRYLWDDADYLWLTQRAPDEDRFLSCNLNMSWPDRPDGRPAMPATGDRAAIDRRLARNLRPYDHHDAACRRSRSRADDDRFGGWLAYSNFDRAWKAVNTLHQLLRRTASGCASGRATCSSRAVGGESHRQLRQDRRDQLLGNEPLRALRPRRSTRPA